ncbi:MAG: cupin domain-containing protein [Acidimicrobiia bacterium]
MRPVLAEAFDLQPHPEGGWYRQTWRADERVRTRDGRDRATATVILFLLPAGESSAWHRVASEEIWLAHRGVVALELGGDGSEPILGLVQMLGVDHAAGQQPQLVVPAGVWQRTLPSDTDALVSCVVSPGFDFEDFELTSDDTWTEEPT